jgi:hypothetical protein
VGWHFDPKGCFSVKPAYRVHRATVVSKQKRQQGTGSGDSSAETQFWNDLWNLDCPLKVKHFLWRLSHNTLALRKILQRRGMKLDTRCCMCGRLDEDGGHLLFKCKEVKKVWRELNLEQVRCRLSEAQSARQMMEMIFKMKGKEQLTVIMLLWLWWGERNKWREEGRRRTASDLAYVAAFHADLAVKNDGQLLSEYRQRSHWQKPKTGELKLNTDGAFNR